MLYKTTIPLLAQIVSIVVSDLALTTLFDTIRRFGSSVAVDRKCKIMVDYVLRIL